MTEKERIRRNRVKTLRDRELRKIPGTTQWRREKDRQRRRTAEGRGPYRPASSSGSRRPINVDPEWWNLPGGSEMTITETTTTTSRVVTVRMEDPPPAAPGSRRERTTKPSKRPSQRSSATTTAVGTPTLRNVKPGQVKSGYQDGHDGLCFNVLTWMSVAGIRVGGNLVRW